MIETNGQMVQTGRYRTHLYDEGEGDVVLLIHGSGPGVSAWANWSRVMPALASRYRVIAPDVVGFGKTQRPDGIRYGLSPWVDQLQAILDALRIDRVHLIGNSLGGALALNLAVRQPQRIGRILLMGSVGVPFDLTEGLARIWGYRGRSRDEMAKMMRFFAWDSRWIPDDLITMRYQASLDPEIQGAYARMFSEPLSRHIAALTTPEEDIRQIKMPTLLLHGRNDQVIPLETSLRLGRLMPRADVHIFSACGHWIQVERTDDFNALALQFFSS